MGVNQKMTPKIRIKREYPVIKIHPVQHHKADSLTLEFREKGIFVSVDVDDCGNDFFIPYTLIDSVMEDKIKKNKPR